jgi:GntR family transcriptional regulator/MocR family aminotransferase
MTRRAAFAELPIVLADDHGLPTHRALYEALRAAMLGGRLRPSSRMPSSRDLARQLGVARGTVVGVYEQLVSEGYLVARSGSGTRVALTVPDRWFRTSGPRTPPGGGAEDRCASAVALGSRSRRLPLCDARASSGAPFSPARPGGRPLPLGGLGTDRVPSCATGRAAPPRRA